MSKISNFYQEIILPIAMIIGHILLAFICVDICLSFEKGYLAVILLVVFWVYGIAFVSEVVPFIKHISGLLVKSLRRT